MEYYFDTFSPIDKITYVRIFIYLVATHGWDLHQVDIKNAFLHGDLLNEVYMEQPLGLVLRVRLVEFVISTNPYVA